MTQFTTYRAQALAGAGLMVAAGALFALINTAVQGATMLYGASSTAVAFWQYLIALLFYIPWIWSHRASVLKTRQLGLHVLRVALAAGGVQLWVAGLAHVPIWQAIALIMLSPFFVTAGAGLILREPVSVARWGAVIAGFAGGMIILEPWSDRFAFHALYPVAAATLWAASSLVTKRLTDHDGTTTMTLWLLLLLTPINGLTGLSGGLSFAWGAPLALVALAGLLTALAQHVLARAYSLADAAYLQPFDHLKLPLNVALGFAAFGFLPTGSMWLGTAVILGASLYLLRIEATQLETT